MSLNDSAAAAVNKKVTLLDKSFSRFAGRSTLAGVYLTVGTAFAGVVGNAVEQLAPGLGTPVFAMIFGLGLFAIVVLGADLATGNMMYMVYGAVNKQVSWGKGLWLLIVTTFFNLLGVILFAAAMGMSAKFSGMDPSHLIVTLSEGKLTKSPQGMFVEAILANFVVNMAIVGGIFAKEVVSKFFMIVPIIACFVGLGLEHVIANFCLFLLTAFGSDPLPAALTIGNVALNWTLVWLGNLVGGGFLIGGVYAWLNNGPEEYRD
ncbi:formate/nitrite transporter family protein [Corynebacterium sp. 32222D000AT]|nr:formate/nitrite transporter family protein [Mycobacteriaceae bacterium]MDY5828400.1 formate/nitrite transporter family protein [Corynebacterium sp.]